jgi:hypothetical protein
MSSTILSSLGEAILHRNSLATITENWIVVREVESHRQILVSINSISQVKTVKTLNIVHAGCAFGCLLVSAATLFSKEPGGATLPFALIGIGLLFLAQVKRQASLKFVSDNDSVQTAYGTLPEAATLVTAISSTRNGKRWGERPGYELFVWWRAYILLLV